MAAVFWRSLLLFCVFLLGLIGRSHAVQLTASSSGSWSSVGTWAPAGRLPCSSDDVVVASGVQLTVDGRARVGSISTAPLSYLLLTPNVYLELKGPGEPTPYWCSAATAYPVQPPTVLATPAFAALAATYNVAFAQNVSLAGLFADINGEALVYSLEFVAQTAGAGPNTALTSVNATTASWLHLSASVDASVALLSGSPFAFNLAGTSLQYRLRASDSSTSSVSSAFTVAISKRPPQIVHAFTPSTLTLTLSDTVAAAYLSSALGVPLTQSIVDPDGGPLSFALAGTLPQGLLFNQTQLFIAGTVKEYGTFPLSLTATDQFGQSTAISFSLFVPAPVIDRPTLPPASSSSTSNTAGAATSVVGAAVGGAIGGVAALVLLVLIVLFFVRRRHQRSNIKEDASDFEMTREPVRTQSQAAGYSNEVLSTMTTTAQPTNATTLTAPAAAPRRSFLDTLKTRGSVNEADRTETVLKMPFRSWTTEDVGLWLTSLGVVKASVKAFQKNNINGANLENFAAEEKLEKVVSAAGDRATIAAAIAQLLESQPAVVSRRSSNASMNDAANIFISRGALVLGDEIASGNFGKVFRGTFKGAAVAIKLPSAGDDATREDFLEEAKLMKSIPAHPNVVQYFGVCVEQTQLYVVIEYCDMGSLQSFVQANPKLPTTTIIHIATQIAAGMSHLSAFIVHRDLAARNILLVSTTSGQTRVLARVADFGLSRPVNNNGYMRMNARHAIPVPWTATEVLNGGAHTPASDVWSYGVVLW